MDRKELIKQLEQLSLQQRWRLIQVMRRQGAIHMGGEFSCTELMVALFHYALNIDPEKPRWEGRDRFVLSKGHCALAMYLSMASRGYFPYEEVLKTYRNNYETIFGIHPCMNANPFIDSTTGSLGHGLSISVGRAIAAKADGASYKVFCMTGDGELEEGSTWEAVMLAPAHKLGNLVLVVDRNRFSLDGRTEDILPLEPLDQKFKDFHWNVIKIEDANDMGQVLDGFDKLKEAPADVPTVILGYTTKGKGLSFIENNALFHNTALNDEQYEAAVAELLAKGAVREECER